MIRFLQHLQIILQLNNISKVIGSEIVEFPEKSGSTAFWSVLLSVTFLESIFSKKIFLLFISKLIQKLSDIL